MITIRKLSMVPVALAVIGSTLALGSNASAQSEPPSVEEPSTSDGHAGDDHAIVETFTIDGDRVATRAYAADGTQIPTPRDFKSQGIVTFDGATHTTKEKLFPQSDDEPQFYGSGNGGTSSARGCIRVNVRNEKETSGGFTAYWFTTWTEWCWNRSSKTMSNVITGYYLEDVDALYVWQDIVADDKRFYGWLSGYTKSGYWHEKQGHFQNCIPKLGCISNSYPRNILKSHSDGTWYWKTYD